MTWCHPEMSRKCFLNLLLCITVIICSHLAVIVYFSPSLLVFHSFSRCLLGKKSQKHTHTICYWQHICMACNCSVVDDPFIVFGVIFSNTLYWWLHSIPRWWACRCNPLMLGAFTRGRLSLLVSCYVVYLPVPKFWLLNFEIEFSFYVQDGCITKPCMLVAFE